MDLGQNTISDFSPFKQQYLYSFLIVCSVFKRFSAPSWAHLVRWGLVWRVVASHFVHWGLVWRGAASRRPGAASFSSCPHSHPRSAHHLAPVPQTADV